MKVVNQKKKSRAMVSDSKANRMLSMAMKAGKVASGEVAVMQSLKKGKTKLLIIAEDASPNTIEPLVAFCNKNGIQYVMFSNRETLGRLIGKGLRSCVSIEDDGFSTQIVKHIMHDN